MNFQLECRRRGWQVEFADSEIQDRWCDSAERLARMDLEFWLDWMGREGFELVLY